MKKIKETRTNSEILQDKRERERRQRTRFLDCGQERLWIEKIEATLGSVSYRVLLESQKQYVVIISADYASNSYVLEFEDKPKLLFEKISNEREAFKNDRPRYAFMAAYDMIVDRIIHENMYGKLISDFEDFFNSLRQFA